MGGRVNTFAFQGFTYESATERFCLSLPKKKAFEEDFHVSIFDGC